MESSTPCAVHATAHRHSEPSEAEIGQIFSQFGPSFRQTHNLSSKQSRVLSALSLCRTGFLGTHKQSCDHCNYYEYLYNSCRDRHCPRCQFKAKESWLDHRMAELLPTAYYHVVFTVPDELRSLIFHNQRLLYDALFKTSSASLLKFGKDPRHLRAQLGFLGILHTWGQKLWFHPHIHYIVPAGGVSEDGKSWIAPKYGGDFLFPVEALSDTFQGKLIKKIKNLWQDKALYLEGELEYLQDERAFDELVNRATAKRWVVFTQPPMASPEKVLAYLGRYTHRVAMSNSRLQKVENGRVEFTYKDYQDKGQEKIANLSVDEFTQRFLWHVLPEGFQKIRYYGFWAGAQRKERIALAQKLALAFQETLPLSERILLDLLDFMVVKAAIACPACQKGHMSFAGSASISLNDYFDTS